MQIPGCAPLNCQVVALMSVVSLQFPQHLYSLQIRDTMRLPKERILTIVFGADTSMLLPFGRAEGGLTLPRVVRCQRCVC